MAPILNLSDSISLKAMAKSLFSEANSILTFAALDAMAPLVLFLCRGKLNSRPSLSSNSPVSLKRDPPTLWFPAIDTSNSGKIWF